MPAACRDSPQAPCPGDAATFVTPRMARGAGLLAAGRGRSKYGIHLEPVSGFEPLTCRYK